MNDSREVVRTSIHYNENVADIEPNTAHNYIQQAPKCGTNESFSNILNIP